MRRKLGTACAALGVVLVLAAGALLAYNRWEAHRAESAAAAALSQVKEAVDGGISPIPNPYAAEMTVAEIDGYGYVGYLSVPSLELELPVMSEWDYTRLRISPCRYSGTAGAGNLVVCAHNYTRHFGALSGMRPGDAVYFTDMDGGVWRYRVAALEVLPPTAVEDMTDSGYALTLFTCTYGGRTRVTVRCDWAS